ncbi:TRANSMEMBRANE PROTEIN [Salix koriyanagi]|uniref:TRANSMEMBRANE PROTEIN n=1 Tax=Salix koriyanagi TaxID=2511006 RepID=A0A9Q0UEL9_9ROSI|nr:TRANSMEMBRANE PROTEIN [Salix koriyanagi]
MTSIDLSFNPLFSCIITLYTLILLYFPQALRLSISPILISTLTLLLFLLRLGAVQRRQLSVTESDKAIQIQQNKGTHFGEASNSSFLTHDFDVSFVEWDVRAPLKVIYEESEGEEEGEGDPNEKDAGQYPTRFGGLGRYPSLAMCYPETDSDSDSDSEGGFSVAGEWASPERFCFNWEEEDREGLLIEIALDSDDRKDMGSDSDAGSGFHVEEDNLIEIDICPAKTTSCFPVKCD